MTQSGFVVILFVGSTVLGLALLIAKAAVFVAGPALRNRRRYFIVSFVVALIALGLVLVAIVAGLRNTHWVL